MTTAEALIELDRVIREAKPEERPGLVVALAAGLALLAARMVVQEGNGNSNGSRFEREPLLLTYQEAAAVLRVSPSYVETLVRQGKLPAVMLPGTTKGTGEHRRERKGRQVRLRPSDLMALVEERPA
jgi:excisionase family DNA binding protein